jgi:hypothetical protein
VHPQLTQEDSPAVLGQVAHLQLKRPLKTMTGIQGWSAETQARSLLKKVEKERQTLSYYFLAFPAWTRLWDSTTRAYLLLASYNYCDNHYLGFYSCILLLIVQEHGSKRQLWSLTPLLFVPRLSQTENWWAGLEVYLSGSIGEILTLIPSSLTKRKSRKKESWWVPNLLSWFRAALSLLLCSREMMSINPLPESKGYWVGVVLKLFS